MDLNFKEYGSGEPLIILHGFMGSLDNWHTLATQFGKKYHVFSVDQRNHGKSQHSDTHTQDLMVADLKEFIESKKLTNLSLLGHSMGGKVVMKFALLYPTLVKRLIVVDIAPRQYKQGHDDVFEAIFAVDLNKIESRKEAEEMMLPFVADFGTRQFLLKNLERKEDGTYEWKMNLRTLHIDYDEIAKSIESEVPFLGSALVIKGGKSKYISNLDEADFKKLFPKYQLQIIEEAGHWVHAEAPKEFALLVETFMGDE